MSEHITGTKNEQYNLVSVLYHALEGTVTYDKYVKDAEQAGDKDLAQFFQEAKEQCQKSADRAKELLAQRLGSFAAR
ncbi:MAG: hypothetical protein JOZ78_23835 [Chroococcidiopsidaceae cyanobacterium CP_BM_ER_R8_30]|nr:hypothetical protein [Chroococcidiopsidaceae cyanobacterium CP_BM_ER_R8_30]